MTDILDLERGQHGWQVIFNKVEYQIPSKPDYSEIVLPEGRIVFTDDQMEYLILTYLRAIPASILLTSKHELLRALMELGKSKERT